MLKDGENGMLKKSEIFEKLRGLKAGKKLFIWQWRLIFQTLYIVPIFLNLPIALSANLKSLTHKL